MIPNAAGEAMNALGIGMRVLGEGGVIQRIAQGEPLEPISPDDDWRLARRIRAMAETVRLTRAELYHADETEYPHWPEPATEPVWKPSPRPLLPINRKERYYTGTVLPAILSAHRFLDLDLFLRMCGFDLADDFIRSDPWIEFVTEYGMAESVFTPEAKAQFPGTPTTKDTPDLIIAGSDWLLIVEAKVFHRPSKAALAYQFDMQKPVVEAIRAGLGIDPSRVRHGFLLIDARTAPPGADFVVTWADVIEAYRGVGPEYWLEALRRAVDAYEELKSKTLFVDNSDGSLTGAQILAMHQSGNLDVVSVGRNGGVNGKQFAADIASGGWATQPYQVSLQPPVNSNWMPVEVFLSAVSEC